MDIKTPKGRETLEQVADAINIWQNNFPFIQYAHTPADKPSDFDGILVGKSKVMGIVEIKCRVSMSLDQFESHYKSEWLVTFDKVMRCMKAADSIQVPFLGFLYFPAEKVLLYKKIYDPANGLNAEIKVSHTRTQRTVNGGKIDRDNAYIDMSDAKRLK